MNNNGLLAHHTGFQYRDYSKDEQKMIKKFLKTNKVTIIKDPKSQPASRVKFSKSKK